MRDARNTTPKDLKIGDIVHFIKVPYFTDDLRLFWKEEKVSDFKYTKSRKRLTVKFESGSEVGLIADSTVLQQSSQGFWEKLEAKRGWRK